MGGSPVMVKPEPGKRDRQLLMEEWNDGMMNKK
jgi:hypothetical protein